MGYHPCPSNLHKFTSFPELCQDCPKPAVCPAEFPARQPGLGVWTLENRISLNKCLSKISKVQSNKIGKTDVDDVCSTMIAVTVRKRSSFGSLKLPCVTGSATLDPRAAQPSCHIRKPSRLPLRGVISPLTSNEILRDEMITSLWNEGSVSARTHGETLRPPSSARNWEPQTLL